MHTPKFVAELTINHLGMVNIAKAMITAAKDSGADYVKLKIKKVDTYYDSNLPDWRNFKFKDYRSSLELSLDDFKALDVHCRNIGIKWFSTIHDIESLKVIQKFNPPMYKIASMDVANIDLVDQVIDVCQQESKTLVISLGGKSHDFTKSLIEKINDKKIKAHILHTVSIYPTPEGQSNIKYLKRLKDTFEKQDGRISFGYSGHEQGYGPSILAAVYGASMIERHFTLSHQYNIHHIKAAITPEEFKSMVQLIKSMMLEVTADDNDMNKDELIFLQKKQYK